MKKFLTQNEAAMLESEMRAATAKSTLGGVGAAASAITLNEWVAIVTIAYFLLQAAYLIWKWRREAKKP